MKPKVSIIVPVYKAESSIRYCIDSILNQTYSDFELILIDDGSPDSSGIICDEYAKTDTRIKVFHKPNGGVSSARNLGIQHSSGSYITFCDSDDYLEPDYLKLMLGTSAKYPEYKHVWCCFQTVTGYSHEDAKINYRLNSPVSYYTIRQYMTLHKMWLDAGPFNKLYDSNIIFENKLFFPEDLSLGEDWIFNMEYLDASNNKKIAVISKPLYNYYKRYDEGLDSKFREDLLNIYVRLNKTCAKYLKKWDVSADEWKIFYDSCFYSYEKVLKNTMKNKTWSCRKKIKWNSLFLQSKYFSNALSLSTCNINPLYKKAYLSGDYRFVLLLDLMVKSKKYVKNSIMSITNGKNK